MDRARLFVPSLLLLASGVACSGGGGGGGGGGGPNLPPPTVTVFLSDSPADDLLSLVTPIEALVLWRQGGGDSGNLLETTVPVDLVALRDTNLPIAQATVPPGIYNAASLTLPFGGIAARAEAGFPVTVNSFGGPVSNFFEPISIANGQEVALQLELDLTRQLTSSGGGLFLVPRTLGFALPAGARVAEFDAVVTAETASQGIFRADLVPQDSGTALGSIQVEVEGTDLLVGADGQLLPSTGAFFSALSVGSRVAVRGTWQAAGFVDATSARIETGSGVTVEITGPILAVDPFNTILALQVGSIESGAAIADPVLDSFGNPAAILLDFDASTTFFLEDPPATASSLDLRVGQRVRARFVTFAGFPLRVDSVSIERLEADFEGTITDTAGLPSSLVVTLDADDPHVLGLLVSGPLQVDLSAVGTPTLLLRGSPPLNLGTSSADSDLLVGQRVTIRGVSVPAGIAATGLEVHPGRVATGTVTFVNAGAGTFDCMFAGPDPTDPFGGTTASPSTVQVQTSSPAFLLLGTNDTPITMAGMASAFLNPPPGQSLRADFQGVGSQTAGTLRAFDVRLRYQ